MTDIVQDPAQAGAPAPAVVDAATPAVATAPFEPAPAPAPAPVVAAEPAPAPAEPAPVAAEPAPAPVVADHPVHNEVKSWLQEMHDIAPHHLQKTFFTHLMENIEGLYERLKKVL